MEVTGGRPGAVAGSSHFKPQAGSRKSTGGRGGRGFGTSNLPPVAHPLILHRKPHRGSNIQMPGTYEVHIIQAATRIQVPSALRYSSVGCSHLSGCGTQSRPSSTSLGFWCLETSYRPSLHGISGDGTKKDVDIVKEPRLYHDKQRMLTLFLTRKPSPFPECSLL